jgi:uncharacterized membrane protein YbjE (DUF340 family)
MFIVIACMISGIGIGYLFRHIKMRRIHTLILAIIWVLLFLMGIEIGSNETVIRQFGELGFDAFLLAVGGVAGSVIAAWLLWLSVKNKSVTK